MEAPVRDATWKAAHHTLSRSRPGFTVHALQLCGGQTHTVGVQQHVRSKAGARARLGCVAGRTRFRLCLVRSCGHGSQCSFKHALFLIRSAPVVQQLVSAGHGSPTSRATRRDLQGKARAPCSDGWHTEQRASLGAARREPRSARCTRTSKHQQSCDGTELPQRLIPAAPRLRCRHVAEQPVRFAARQWRVRVLPRPPPVILLRLLWVPAPAQSRPVGQMLCSRTCTISPKA
jgi:hypothetical protein